MYNLGCIHICIPPGIPVYISQIFSTINYRNIWQYANMIEPSSKPTAPSEPSCFPAVEKPVWLDWHPKLPRRIESPNMAIGNVPFFNRRYIFKWWDFPSSKVGCGICYCWWFRNPKANHRFGCRKSVVNNRRNYQPQLVSLPDFSHQQYYCWNLTYTWWRNWYLVTRCKFGLSSWDAIVSEANS